MHGASPGAKPNRGRALVSACSSGLGRPMGKSSSSLPAVLVSTLTATVVSFHLARYTLPKDPSPICFCMCSSSMCTCAREDTKQLSTKSLRTAGSRRPSFLLIRLRAAKLCAQCSALPGLHAPH